MEYCKMKEENIDSVIRRYVSYYNDSEGGCWTYEKAWKRIHQIMTMEDSQCVIQYEHGNMTGFAMGYYKVFDDLTAYYLEEIVIFKNYQNQGYGAALLEEIEKMVKKKGAEHIEFICMKDEHHMHFYGKLGYYASERIALMGKHF